MDRAVDDSIINIVLGISITHSHVSARVS